MIAVKIRLQDTKNGPARRPPKTRQNRAAEKTFFKTCQKPSKLIGSRRKLPKRSPLAEKSPVLRLFKAAEKHFPKLVETHQKPSKVAKTLAARQKVQF